MKWPPLLAALALVVGTVRAAEEHEGTFYPATDNPLVGDWAGPSPGYVAQVIVDEHGDYRASLLRRFDTDDKPLADLKGKGDGADMQLLGSGWSTHVKDGHLLGTNGVASFDLQHITRVSPTVGAKPPEGAVILFDGKNLAAWAKKKGKDWLTEDGAAGWKILPDGTLEVVPGSDCIITHRKFGDCHIHVEFRTLGWKSNSGVFMQTRYEANINETYGRFDEAPNAGFDNCTPKEARLHVRPCFPPLAWQTFDIDFAAPRFDKAGNKTAEAKATVVFNGVKIYDQRELDPPHGAAGRLGEAPTGPLMLQEHGMPVQFRNIWLVETGS